ncbi:LOW QUALITY PROTEIN: hypothetical protein CVT26_015406 [Gymnopilus dilepis]|uniref:Uncharacterized protein n=1 Tax=Gymnopilus dilepis TaxID=231916 RepID=A0A409YEC3_9AGAR|nr:LOW QUALITY PROTEIN: hypothetical protein CVT26_015406 [Gymnopilus dilepis]
MTQIQSLLHGGSSKRMYPTAFSSLPLAICPDPNQSPNDIVSGSEGVKDATIQYFVNLYHRTPRPPQHKPWMECSSVQQVAERVDSEPFEWPRTLHLADLRRLLSKGNSRPTPGPDGWEKWFLRPLSDDALKPVLNLANYIISQSRFPDCVKPTNISTIHKKGPNTFLSNYRGIACSNFILNLPFAWLNHLLSPYLARLRIIPDSQVATQPGVQGRDIISYVSQLECWAKRENVPLYMLQRDQKKGFDMLEPQGFYDAVQAYHLPSAIIDLDRSSQTEVPYRIKTAYGFTDTFIVNGVTKQGGSHSPIKCTLTTSMSNRWLDDELTKLPQPLIISSHQSRTNIPHIPADSLVLRPSMIEAMDDTLLPATSLSTLYFLARRADRNLWETEWKKSALYIYNDPIYTRQGAPETSNMPSISYADPQADCTYNNKVPVVTDHTTFLRVPINRPDLQFAHLRDIVMNFHFPVLKRRLPLTALRRIISQQVISKIRPHISLQPIAHGDATSLDHLLSAKVHEYLGFPFRFNPQLLTQPLRFRGFDFPSISRINSSLAVSGLQRDLNHHLTPFRHMSAITLADWTCQFNGCINPLSPIARPNIKTINSEKVPSAWALAAKVIKQLSLSLAETDLSYIADGSVGTRHITRIGNHLRPESPSIPSRSITNFEKAGWKTHNQLGQLIPSDLPAILPISLRPRLAHAVILAAGSPYPPPTLISSRSLYPSFPRNKMSHG